MSIQYTKVASGADFWQNRGFNDKSVKTSQNIALGLLNKIGYVMDPSCNFSIWPPFPRWLPKITEIL